MCARWPTIAMSKFFSEVWTKLLPLHGCHVMRFGVMCLWFDLLSNDVASCEVICGTTPTLLLCTLYYKVLPQYYSVLPVLQRTTLYCKVLLQYYSVLQSTTPVLPSTTTYYSVLQSTTRYYSSTTLYYKVLLQYYSVPVLQRTTLYYQVLLQYYSVLQSTTPVLLCTTKYYASTTRTTKYYSSTTLYYKVLLQYYSCTTKYYSGTTLYYSSTTTYYASTTLYYKVLQRTTPVLLCTKKYYSSTTLYYKVLLQYYSPVLQRTTLYYKVLQSTTPVLLCTTKYYSSTTPVLQSTTPVLLCTTKFYASTTLHYPVLQRTTLYYKVLRQYYSVLQSSTPVLLCTARRNKSHRPTSPNTAPATQNECHQWSASHMKAHFQCVDQGKVSLQPHQILRLPRKMNVTSDLRHIWNVISNARSKYSQHPTSPNAAPATQNQCHQRSAAHMKRHFQCAEQLKSPSNLTKYCACHETLKLKISSETPWSASANRKTIRR